MGARMERLIAFCLLGLCLLLAPAANAVTIQRVISPGGIEAWLVEQHTIPLIAMDFAFRGGAKLDPAGKVGLARLAAATIDEGAGGLLSALPSLAQQEAVIVGDGVDDGDETPWHNRGHFFAAAGLNDQRLFGELRG